MHYVTGFLEYRCQIISPRIKSLHAFFPCAGRGLKASTGCMVIFSSTYFLHIKFPVLCNLEDMPVFMGKSPCTVL